MLARLTIALATLLSAACAISLEGSAMPLDFCELAESAASYEGQSVVLTARIVDTGPHGWFAEDISCPNKTVLLYPMTDPDKVTLRAVAEASNRRGVLPEKVATFRATVVMREWQMPGADVVRDRPYLEVTEVIGWDAVS